MHNDQKIICNNSDCMYSSTWQSLTPAELNTPLPSKYHVNIQCRYRLFILPYLRIAITLISTMIMLLSTVFLAKEVVHIKSISKEDSVHITLNQVFGRGNYEVDLLASNWPSVFRHCFPLEENTQIFYTFLLPQVRNGFGCSLVLLLFRPSRVLQ